MTFRGLIVDAFEQNALMAPDKVCIVDHSNGNNITYDVLNKKTNKLAHYLRINHSIDNNTVVAVNVERSSAMITSLLAILKTGASYTPIDPSFPEERIDYILADSRAKIVLVTRDSNYKQQKCFKILCLDDLDYHEYSDQNFTTKEVKNLPAYIIYTSGSTGKPKGVIVGHDGVVNYVRYMSNIIKDQNIGYINAVATDLGYTSLFTALLSGKTLHILEKDTELDVYKLLQYFEVNLVDVIKTTPSYYSMLEAEVESLPHTSSLRRLMSKMQFILGGEALPSKYLRQDRNIVNHYGPTETTIGVTTNHIDKSIEYGSLIIPIGKSIGNAKIYVLDEDMNLLPIGAKGELYITGPGVAIGYINKPDLTSERFIANPFRSKQELEAGINDRLYRSGDIGRYLSDGTIEFIGRKDDQIKIRGYRIELGEIEGVLKSHGDVKGAVVIATLDKIIAYILPGEFRPTDSELGSYLKKYLPEYMLPSYYIFIETLPLTKSGKVDKRALPDPSSVLQNNDTATYQAPRDKLEQELCQIWQEVLSVSKVGITDNFFKLGGHSLLAIRLVSKLRQKYGKEIKIISLFDKPTIKELKEEINQTISQEKKFIIPRLDPRPQTAELSFAEQRLWFLDKLTPDKVIYNMPIALELSGKLNPTALKKAFEAICERHEILRTIFKETDSGEAYREILERVTIYEEIDVSNQPKAHKADLIEKYKLQEANWKFDLSTGPLCRVKLLILEQELHVLLITMHHIISDGWSIGVLNNELSILYQNYAINLNQPLPELRIQYVDYSTWQRSWLTEKTLDNQLNYWKTKLQGLPAEIGLPFDRPRPKELTYEGGYHIVELDKDLSSKVQAICVKHDVSLYMFLLSAFNVLLYKLSGNNDIVVGTPTAGRHIPDTEELIGFFVNTLVMRSNLSGKKTFMQLLSEVRADALQSYEHQDIPFEKLVDFLDIERSTNKNPVFQVMFDIKNYSSGEQEVFPGLSVQSIASKIDIAKFDLEFIAHNKSDGNIFIRINYAKDLFDPSVVAQYGKYYCNLIQMVVKNLNENIGNIKLLQPEVPTKKRSENAVIMDSAAHELFESKVIEVPDSIAVTDGVYYITYNTLNELSNTLAHYLTDIGVGPESFVAMSNVREINSIVALLAILKSGGVYLPIDPSYPDERINFILNDSKPDVFITSETLSLRFKGLFEGRVVCLEDMLHFSRTYNLNKKIPSYSLAYLIYTSGTTGTPKGVTIPHHSLLNRLNSIDNVLNLSRGDRMLQQASLSFDVSLQEILCTLLSGATLFVSKEDLGKESDKIIELIKKFQITVAEFIPSFFNSLLSEYDFKKHVYLNKVVVGGEAMPPSLIENFRRNLDAQLINMCGPTEVCMDSTYWICDDITPKLGRTFNGFDAYVLDKDLNIAPYGQVGELYLASDSMGRGYLNKQDLTAERFIANPFDDAGQRLYNSGDLVRWLPCGNLDYIGRRDFQVKIRGFRVEIEEVERALDKFTEMQQKAVIVMTNNAGNKYLACYYVAKHALDDQEIVGCLRERLPEYMIPNMFTWLSSFPLTVNGKIDRKALELIESKNKQYYVEPRNEIEKILCKVWEEVLGVESVSISDNFFRLGGDSIMTIQVLSKARSRGITFNLKDIFDYPQILLLSKVSTVVTALPRQRNKNQKVSGAVRLLPIQSIFFRSMGVTNFNHYNQSIILAFAGELKVDLLKEAMTQLTEQHDMLRARYKIDGNKIEQKIYNQRHYLFDFCDLRDLGDKEQIIAINDVSNTIHQKIDITKNLMGIGVYRVKNEEYRIFITIHHLVIDEVSWRIIKDDLEVLYLQLAQGPDKTLLPDKTTSYKEWSAHLKTLVLQTTQHELEYWQNIDDKLFYNPRTFSQSYQDLIKRLGREYTSHLLRRAHDAYRTDTKEILLVTLSLALERWDENLLTVIDVEGHGRENITEDLNIDLSRTVGWFTTIYPVDIDTRSCDSIESAIKCVKEKVRSVPNRGIRYGALKLYHKLRNHDGGADILFNYLGQRHDTISSHAFTFANEPRGLNISKDNRLSHKIVINCSIQNDTLSIRFTYDDILFSAQSIDTFATTYLTILQNVIDVCVDSNNFGYTASDFKNLSFLSQETIDTQLGKIQYIEDAYRLSPIQSGFLFTDAIIQDSKSKDASGYIVQSVYKIEDDISVELLQSAWDVLIHNNSILRTGFLWQQLEEPIQFVVSRFVHDFRLMHLISQEIKDLEVEVMSSAHQEKSRSFDLSQPPLSKIVIILVDGRASYMIWTTHHIIVDGWTTSLLLGELRDIYIALKEDRTLIQNQHITYKDYIYWVYNQDRERALASWKSYLAGINYNNALCFGNIAIDDSNVESDSNFIFEIDHDLSENLRHTALKMELTPNTLFQAALGIILHKYSKLSDFTFGITVSGRAVDLEGISNLVGLSINTLPLRIKVDSAQSFREFVNDLRDATLFINQTSYISLAEIQKLAIQDRKHLFNTIFVYENYPKRSTFSQNRGIIFNNVSNFSKTEYPFAIVVYPKQKFTIRIIYNSKLFDLEFLKEFQINFLAMLRLISDGSEKVREASVNDIIRDYDLVLKYQGIDACLESIITNIAQYTASQSLAIESGISQSLKSLCHAERIPLSATVQYALQKALSIYHSTYEVVVTLDIPIDDNDDANVDVSARFWIINDEGEGVERSIIEEIKESEKRAETLNNDNSISIPALQKWRSKAEEVRNLNFIFVLQCNFGASAISQDTRTKDIDKYIVIMTHYEDQSQGGLVLDMHYNTTLLTEVTAQQIILSVNVILGQLAENPHKNNQTLSYLTSEDYTKIIQTWNQTDKPYPLNKTIHELFEEQVKRTPDNIAIIYEDTKLTYRELNERANRLAHYLKSNYSISQDTLVPLLLDRSENMIISILAVLKAGGAYVPIEPSYPDERIRYIIEDVSIANRQFTRDKTKDMKRVVGTVLLTTKANSERLHKLAVAEGNNKENLESPFDECTITSNISILSIDSLSIHKTQEGLQSVSSNREDALLNCSTSTNLAYVIYTSGTTGNPKGVMVEHSNVIRLFTATDNWYKFNQGEVWTLFHSYAFDFSVWEIWGALCYGGKLIVTSYNDTRDLRCFYDLCKKEKVTVLNQTPNAFYQFMDIAIHKVKENNLNKLKDLKYVIFGGEVLNCSRLKTWFDCYGYNQPKLINMYGITETTVHVTYREIREQDLYETASIGKRIPDLKTYVLSSTTPSFPILTPIPIGAIGELYIGGAGVARGYLNRPDLTEERFLPNPFQTEEEKLDAEYGPKGRNARIYKTGDLVRLLPCGNLEYIGRNDFQVKIRGYRIELGEIEAALASFSGVKQCVVLARDHKIGGDNKNEDRANSAKYLVAYYVSDSSYILDTESIISYLSAMLPYYMIPSAFVHLEKLPLTVNSKIDRNALPELEFEGNQASYIAPRNDIEKTLCNIWAEVLTLEEGQIGINDNFFQLGGHSIKLMQLASLVERSKINIPISYMLQNPTIRAMALYVLENSNKRELTETVDDLFYAKNIYKLLDVHSIGSELEVVMPISVDPHKLSLDKLFIIHPGGGLAFPYFFLEKHLNYCVIGINNPHFYKPDEFDSVQQIAKFYLNEITKIQPTGPYNFAGFSFGGCVAYEMSRILYLKIKEPSSVILMDTTVDFKNVVGELKEAKYCDDQTINDNINKNIAHFDKLSTKYKYQRNQNNILLIKNKKNTSSLKKQCLNYQEVIIKGTHATFLNEDATNLTNTMNKFLSH